MEKWVTRAGRAAVMGLGWGVAWVPVGLMLGWLIDPTDSMDEPWLIAGMIAGFPCGAVFSFVTGIADGRRALTQLPVSRAGARGLVSGLIVGGLWIALALASDPPKWMLWGVVVGSVTLLSALSGVGTAWLARMGKGNARAHAT
jgi:hypothetical protein